jgi:hypothetical protein
MREEEVLVEGLCQIELEALKHIRLEADCASKATVQSRLLLMVVT